MYSNSGLIRNLARWGRTAALLAAGAALGSAAMAQTPTTAVAQHSGKCLDVRGGPGATGDGARIEQWACTGQSNQAWTLKDMGGARYEFIANHSGKCMEVLNGATANGAAIQQATCTGMPQQLWTLKSQGNGTYQVLSVPSGRCLDVTGGPTATADGVFTELWDCTGQANQIWALTPPATAQAQQVVVQHSGQCLDVRGGVAATADGALIEQWPCSGMDNQKWTLRDMGNSRFELVVTSSGKCIEVRNGGTANGSAIQQATCTGSTRQLWTVKPLGGGQNQIIAAGSGRCLDVTGGPGATAQGTLTELWDCTGQPNQSWAFSASGSTPPPPTGTPGPYGQDASQYNLVFADEFEGTSLDTSKWIDHLWYQPADTTPNYAVSNGSLKIWPVAGTDYKRDYRHITTDGRYYQTYGFYEIEAKLPRGKGPWPAFWLYNHDSAGDFRPEIDIMEAYPGGGPNSGWSDANLHPTAFAATVWRGNPGDQAGFKMLQTTDLSAGFHKYAVKWEPGKQTFYFDGQPFYTLNVSMSNRMYILLSFQFGSASGPGDASTPTGQGNSFEVRYVRAWSFKNAQTAAKVVAYHGDSTVWGYRSGVGDQVPTPAPRAFADALIAAGREVDVRNEGVSGTTACDLLNGTDGKHAPWSSYIASSPAQAVIINHAINDEWRYDVATYQSCLRQLAQLAKGRGKQVIFETPNPTRDSGPNGLDVYVNAMKQVASQEGLPVIDQYANLTAYLNGRSITTICPDGVHPSEDVYMMKGQYAAQRFAGM
ncbi:RICIN domain-containing protein [Ideonella sp. BN130291]|uniref:RICIN domain-containing protein n=1 Tax=Ideonella sp. BN130291 TaxID=3112940 RepID=UPI002E26364F|nr:RICIN domain-containing protein [Ideonella sp. BN130291]